jgi:hypothetical protein
MTTIDPRPIYESPPGSRSNDGALPTVYDPGWQVFNNLTPQQITAFQSFPQDLTAYASTKRWHKEIANNTAGFITVNNIPVDMSESNRALLLGLARAADRNINGGTFSFTDNGVGITLTAAQGISLVDAVMSYIQTCRTTEKTMLDGINAKTITTRAQIDTAFAAIPSSF